MVVFWAANPLLLHSSVFAERETGQTDEARAKNSKHQERERDRMTREDQERLRQIQMRPKSEACEEKSV